MKGPWEPRKDPVFRMPSIGSLQWCDCLSEFRVRIDEHGDDENIDEPIGDEELVDDQEGSTGSNCLVCNDCGSKFTSVPFAQLHAAKTGHEDFAESTEAIPTLTEEQKKERLAQLRQKLAEKRKQDAVKRDEEEKQNELIRRKATKDTAEIKKQLEEKEAKKALDERMRQRQEDFIQKERIRAQIEDDRRRMKEKADEDKRRAQGIIHIQAEAQPRLVAEAPTIQSDSTRLHIRLPDGKALRETIPSVSTLNDLLSIVEDKSGLSASHHLLMIALPPRNFDAATEGSKNMTELGLSPSAALVYRKNASF